MRSSVRVTSTTIATHERRWQARVARWAALLGSVALVSVLHYVTPRDHFVLHAVYHRSYYVPVVMAAYWYGAAGGVATAIVCAVAYIPHVQTAWFLNRPYTVNQYAETVVFVLLGLAVGLIASYQRRMTDRYRRTAQSLEQANRELVESGEQLRRAERLSAVGEIAAGLAHEIRNPLAGVKGALEIVTAKVPADTPEADFAAIASREVARLEGLVQEFLDYASPRPPQLGRVNVDSLLGRLIALLKPQADRAGVTLVVEAGERGKELSADVEQIEQVLVNVILNAVDASPRCGRVVVTHGAVDGRYCLSISDQGAGIRAEILERIFEPFFTTKERGTGLGLAISQRIVAAHNGEIHVSSVGRRGTTVEIVLPDARSGNES